MPFCIALNCAKGSLRNLTSKTHIIDEQLMEGSQVEFYVHFSTSFKWFGYSGS